MEIIEKASKFQIVFSLEKKPLRTKITSPIKCHWEVCYLEKLDKRAAPLQN